MSLTEQINDADEATWRKIKKLLGVSTRQEAATRVSKDSDSASSVSRLLTSSSSSGTPSSLLTSGMNEPDSAADVLYPKQKKRRTRMEF